MERSFLSAALGAALVLGAGCNQRQTSEAPTVQPQAAEEPHDQHSEEMEGFAIALAPTQGSSATGTVMLMSMGDGVHFSGVVSGLTPGKHAIHVHEKGDCGAPDPASAGGHFNPTAANHGAPNTIPHHAGDLGNIEAGADGRAEINIHANGLALQSGANSVLGKALIVHAGEDDFKTQPTGNAGGRVACGAIQGAE